jgi:hypothetical protein
MGTPVADKNYQPRSRAQMQTQVTNCRWSRSPISLPPTI